MSTVAAAPSSASDALVSLLRSNVPTSPDAPSTGTAARSAASGSAPATMVELSDQAKALLARNKIDQVVAQRLQALIQTLKGKGGDTIKPGANTGQDVFERLTAGNTTATFDQLDDYLKSLFAANKNADGTYSSFSKTLHDVITAPSTPAEIENWYKTQGQSYIEGAQQLQDKNYLAFAEAIQNRAVTIQSASEIPDLNFHNSWILQGGEGGGSINGTSSYNHNAAIFKDPATNYIVDGNGTVISWKKPPQTTAT